MPVRSWASTLIHPKRDSAEQKWWIQNFFDCCEDYVKVNIHTDHFSEGDVWDALKRYPSLYRSAYSPSRPIHLSRQSFARHTIAIGYQGKFGRLSCIGCAVWGVIQPTTIGRDLCKRHQSFLQWWQYSVWQVASTTTQSARSLVLAQALLHQKCWALIAQAPWLSVPRQACSATTPAFAVDLKTSIASSARQHLSNRRGDSIPAAVF